VHCLADELLGICAWLVHLSDKESTGGGLALTLDPSLGTLDHNVLAMDSRAEVG
jgi:hypothetical protein